MSEREKEKLKRKTDASVEAFKSFRLRWVTARSKVKMEIDEEKYQKAVDSIMKDEVERHMITGALKEKGPLTVEELAELTDLQPSLIVRHLIALRKNGAISEAGEKNRQYLYKLV
jgi:DNA-binding transcriptional ArsR family regulator